MTAYAITNATVRGARDDRLASPTALVPTSSSGPRANTRIITMMTNGTVNTLRNNVIGMPSGTRGLRHTPIRRDQRCALCRGTGDWTMSPTTASATQLEARGLSLLGAHARGHRKSD